MIGLTAKQIRQLSKGAYSDKQIVNTAQNASGEILKSGDLWWSNGTIVLFERAPMAVQMSKSASYKVQAAKTIGLWLSKCKTEVYPAEVIPFGDNRAIRFRNAKGDRVTANAKYVAAMLATKRAGKDKDPDVRFYTDNDPTMPVLLAVNGHKIGLVACEKDTIEDPEWRFFYTGKLPD